MPLFIKIYINLLSLSLYSIVISNFYNIIKKNFLHFLISLGKLGVKKNFKSNTSENISIFGYVP
jgi:hypothetical protein